MNTKVIVYLMVAGCFIRIPLIQSASSAPLVVPIFSGSQQKSLANQPSFTNPTSNTTMPANPSPTISNPQTNPVIPVPIPSPNNLSIQPTPTNPPAPAPAATPVAMPPVQKQLSQKQAENAILKQIQDKKAPAKINCFGLPEISLYNTTSASLYVGFENGISLSEIFAANGSAKNSIQVPHGKNYLIYTTNNPSNRALYLYKSDSNKTGLYEYYVCTCSTQNGSPYACTDSQKTPITDSAYISVHPQKPKELIISERPY